MGLPYCFIDSEQQRHPKAAVHTQVPARKEHHKNKEGISQMGNSLFRYLSVVRDYLAAAAFTGATKNIYNFMNIKFLHVLASRA